MAVSTDSPREQPKFVLPFGDRSLILPGAVIPVAVPHNNFANREKDPLGNIFQSAQDVDEIFSNLIKQDDYLMIKGSNSTGLNKVSKKIIKGEKIVI